MEVSEVLAATLSPTKEIRVAAEAQLRSLGDTPGFGLGLFQVLASPQFGVAPRHAAAIYFKHFVDKYWDSKFSEEERQMVRNNLVNASVSVEVPSIRTQLALVMRKVADEEFPAVWPTLVDGIISHLETTDVARVSAALYLFEVLSKVSRLHRPYNTRSGGSQDAMQSEAVQVLEQVVARVAPTLLHLLGGVLANPDWSIQSGEIVKLIAKIHWNLMHTSAAPACLVEPQTFNAWLSKLAEVYILEIPEAVQDTDHSERQSSPWWKAKKWVAHSMIRFLQSYDPATTGLVTLAHAVGMTQACLGVVQQWCSGNYISQRVQNTTLTFLTTSVQYKDTYAVYKEHLPQLLTNVVCPLLCFSAEHEDLWNNEPDEYIRVSLDIMAEIHSPSSSALQFLQVLVMERSKTVLPMAMQLLSQKLNDQTQTPSQRYGTLGLIIGLKRKLCSKKPELREQGCALLVNHVIPLLTAAEGYVRARACIICSEFVQLVPPGAPFEQMLVGVTRCLSDQEAPVRVNAATAVGSLVECTKASDQLKPHLGPLLEVLCTMINSVGNEEVITTLGAIVDEMPDEIAPYAVNLCQMFAQSFVKMIDAAAEESDDEECEDDSSLAAVGCIAGINSILQVVKPEMQAVQIPQMEPFLLPMVAKMMTDGQSGQFDFLDEVLEIVESLATKTPAIRPEMWQMFIQMAQMHNNGACDFISAFARAMAPFISRMPAVAAQPLNQQAIFSIVQHTFGNSNAAEEDFHLAIRLASFNLQHIKGQSTDAAPLVQEYLGLCVHQIDKEMKDAAASTEDDEPTGVEREADAILRSLLCLIGNCLIFEPRVALTVLEANGWTATVFTVLFNLLPGFTEDGEPDGTERRRTVMVALASVLMLGQELPASVQAMSTKMIEAVGWLKGTIKTPQELAELAKEEAEDEEDDEDDDDDGIFGGFGGGQGDDDDDGGEEDEDKIKKFHDLENFDFGSFGMFGEDEEEIELPISSVDLGPILTQLAGLYGLSP